MSTITVKNWKVTDDSSPEFEFIPPEYHVTYWEIPKWWYKGAQSCYTSCVRIDVGETSIYVDGTSPLMQFTLEWEEGGEGRATFSDWRCIDRALFLNKNNLGAVNRDESDEYIDVEFDDYFYRIRYDNYNGPDVIPPEPPWEGHYGGRFHIKSVQNAALALTGGPFTAWDIDGINERQITEVAVGEELVFVTIPNCAKLFKGNTTPTWEFGELTDTSKVKNMSEMLSETSFNQPIGEWDVSNVHTLGSLFYKTPFNQDISGWDTSSATSMSYMFYGTPFNEDISGWDTSNVTNMRYMFDQNTVFNQDIGEWDVSNVMDMSAMFIRTPFNQDISGWDTSNVTNMFHMFELATVFNQDIGEWDVSNVTDMSSMFKNASSFNQNLSQWSVSKIPSKPTDFDTNSGFEGQITKQPQWGWGGNDGGRFHIKNVQNAALALTGGPFTAWDTDFTNERQITEVAVGEELVFVTSPDCGYLFEYNETQTWEFGDLTATSKVTNMRYMFHHAEVFNADISSWNTSNVTSMNSMFRFAELFNQDIGSWNTSNVTDMRHMFQRTRAFNADIGSWDVSNVNDMRQMFSYTNAFNANIGSWNTSKVTSMRQLFRNASAFNQNISDWDTFNVTEMEYMFWLATVFDQDISNWCVSKIPSKPDDFDLDSGFEGQITKQPQWGTCP